MIPVAETQSPSEIYYDTLRYLAREATVVRDQIYLTIKQTPLGKLVDRINTFINANATLIFWGAACFFAATQPSIFAVGFALGLSVGALAGIQSEDAEYVDLTALKQIIKAIVFIASNWLNSTGRVFIAGCSPGYHIYSLFSGDCYGKNMKGFAALGQEVNLMCWELAHWIPFLDVKQHRQLRLMAHV